MEERQPKYTVVGAAWQGCQLKHQDTYETRLWLISGKWHLEMFTCWPGCYLIGFLLPLSSAGQLTKQLAEIC